MSKARNGGGIKSRVVNNRPMPKTSAPAMAINPAAAAQIGRSLITPKDRMVTGVADRSGVPLGNAKAMDVGGGGPGKGRTVMPSGGQGQH